MFIHSQFHEKYFFDSVKKAHRGIQTKFTPSREDVDNLKRLLGYRMRAYRYPLSQFVKDLTQAKSDRLEAKDIISLLSSSPFRLAPKQILLTLQIVTETENPSASFTISLNHFTEKFSAISEEFKVIP